MNASGAAEQDSNEGAARNGAHVTTQEGTEGSEPSGVWLSQQSVRQMRRNLHELANTLTGVMIAGGLLNQYLDGGSLAGYAADVCESAERGSHLVRELRGPLLEACGEGAAGGALPKPVRQHEEATGQ